MNIIRRKRLPKTLPAIRVSEDTHANVVAIAQETGASLAEVQRTALEFFLSKNDSITTKNGSISVEKGKTT